MGKVKQGKIVKIVGVVALCSLMFVGCQRQAGETTVVTDVVTEAATEVAAEAEAEVEAVAVAPYETVTFEAPDGLLVTADLYRSEGSTKWLVMGHQHGYNRSEYRTIAQQLIDLGYNALAVDLRNGGNTGDVVNETAKLAKEKGLATERTDAYQDLNAAVAYVKGEQEATYVVTVGSSYSCALALIAAKENPDVDAVAVFSPGENVRLYGKSVSENIKGLNKPVFITSGGNETLQYKFMLDSIDQANLTVFVPDVGGNHGVRSLWPDIPDNEVYWEALSAFLGKL